MALELIRLRSGKAVFIDRKRNKIFSHRIDPEAQEILNYFSKIPVNNY